MDEPADLQQLLDGEELDVEDLTEDEKQLLARLIDDPATSATTRGLLTKVWDQAQHAGLYVTEGIEDIDDCSCGEPIAYWRGEWLHVFNEELRGTDDHNPHPWDAES